MKKRFKIGTALALSILFNMMPTNIVDVKAEENNNTINIAEEISVKETYSENPVVAYDDYSIPEEEPLLVTTGEVSTADAHNIEISEPANAPNVLLSENDGEVSNDQTEEEVEEVEETHKVIIHIMDNRDGSYKSYKDFEFEAGARVTTSPDGLTMYTIFGIGSRLSPRTLKFEEGNYTYTFTGWYLDSTNSSAFTNTTGIPNDSFSDGFTRFSISTSTSYPNAIVLNVNDELNEDVDVYLYANWEKEETPIARIHIYDTFDGETVETSKSPITRTSGGSKSYYVYELLDKVTVNSGQTFTVGNKTYTFEGWSDEDGNPISSEGTTIDEVTFTQLLPSNSRSNGLKIAAGTLTKVSDINIYARWNVTEIPDGKVTIHFYDSIDEANPVDTGDTLVAEANKQSVTKYLREVYGFDTNFQKKVGDVLYEFKGLYDAEGFLIDEDYFADDYLSNIYTTSRSDYYNYKLTAKALDTLDDDVDYNVYARWDIIHIPDGKVTIHFYDSFDESNPVDTGEVLVAQANTQSSSRTIKDIYGFNANYEIKVGNVVYGFDGLYDEKGVLIDENYIPEEYLSSLITELKSDPYNYRLIGSALKTLDDDVEINVYAKWTFKAEPHTITFNYYGVKDGEVELVKSVDRIITPGTEEVSIYTLDQIFSENNEGRKYTGVKDENSNTESDKNGKNIYTFVGWYDAPENGTLIDENYQLPEEYKNAFKSIPAPAGYQIESRIAGENPYEISYQTQMGIDKDYVVNFYAYWDTFVTPVLHLEFVNNISYDENISWENVTGGTSLLDYELRVPDDAPDHYKFLYWQDENGIKYETGHYIYDFTDKESGFVDSITFYAVWQPSVTLNVYKDENSYSNPIYTEESFDKVSLDREPIGYGYDNPGYEFDGYYLRTNGEEDSKVDIITEYTAPGTTIDKVDQLVYNVYATWVTTKVDLTFTKVFEDTDESLRPDSIDIIVKADNEEYKTITLYKDNNWTETITVNKYKYDENGENPVEIIYSIEEVPTSYYNSSISKNENSFTITNKLKDDGYIVVKHIDIDAPEEDNVLLEESYHDTIDKEYHTAPVDFEHYELVKTPENADGFYTDELQEVVYQYQRKQAKVIIHYMDKNGDPIVGVNYDGEEVKDFDLLGKEGLSYDTTPYKENIVGYKYLSKVGYETGTFESRVHEVTYIYEKSDSRVIVHHINNETQDEFKTEYIDGIYGEEYKTNYVDEVPYEVVLPLPENATGTFNDKDIHVTYYYNINTGIVEVHYKDIDNQEIDLDYVEIPGITGEEYTTIAKEINGYQLLDDETVGETIGTFPENETKVVIYYYKKLGKIIVKHIDMYTKEVIAEEEYIDLVGEEFTSSPIEKDPYFVVTSPESETVTYQKDDVELIYYYNRNGKVDVYYIDTDNNILFTTDVTGNLGSSYETDAKSFDNYNLIMIISDEDNNATSGIITDYNKKVTYIYEVIPEEVNTSMIIVKYVNEETEVEISPKDYIRGNVGDEYTISFKEIDGYEYSGRVDGEEYSTFADEAKTITYYYTKKDDEDSECHENCCDCSGNSCNTCPYGLVITKYEDEVGNTIHEQNVEKVSPNGQYTTSKLLIEGYEFVKVSDDSDPVEGVYVENEENKPISVTYVYKKTNSTEIKDAHLIVKYVEGDNLLDKEVKAYKIGDFYFTTRKKFDGYVFVDVDHDEEGYISDQLTTIIYTYKKVEEDPVEPEVQPKDVTILVQYLDNESNNPIFESMPLSGKEGQTYTITRKPKDGYNLLEPDFEELGVYSENKVLTYYYEKVKDTEDVKEKAYVLVHYVDKDRNPIISDDLVEGFVGENYTIPTKVISGYNLVDIVREEPVKVSRNLMLKGALDDSKDNIGTYVSGTTELYFIYDKVDSEETEEPTTLKPAMLVVHHVDVNGSAVAEDDVQKGLEGDFYNASQKVVNGYKFVSVDTEETTGVLKAGQTVITYKYEKLSEEESGDDSSSCNCNNCCSCTTCDQSGSTDGSESNQPVINIDININNENNSDNHSENNNDNTVDNHADNHNDVNYEDNSDNHTDVNVDNHSDNHTENNVNNDTTVDTHNDINNDNSTAVNNENNNQDENNVNIENNPVNTTDVDNSTNVESNPTNTVENNTNVENNPTNNNESSSNNNIEQNPSIVSEGGNSSSSTEVNPTINVEGAENTNTNNNESNPTINVEGGNNTSESNPTITVDGGDNSTTSNVDSTITNEGGNNSSNIDNSPSNTNEGGNNSSNIDNSPSNTNEGGNNSSNIDNSPSNTNEGGNVDSNIESNPQNNNNDENQSNPVNTNENNPINNNDGSNTNTNTNSCTDNCEDKCSGESCDKPKDEDDHKDDTTPSQKGILVVNYLDEDDKTIAASVISMDKVGETYVSNQKDINGYEFDKVVGNTIGKYNDNVTLVNYYYKKLDSESGDEPTDPEPVNPDIPEIKYGTVVVRYFDNDGNTLIEEIITKDKVNEDYVSIQKAFEGYQFVTVAGNRSGKYVDGVIEVSYFYEKVNAPSDNPEDTDPVNPEPDKPEEKYGKVIINYIDTDGNELLDSLTWTGKVGVEYESVAKDIESYKLVNILGEEKGLYTIDPKEVTYVYEKLTGKVIAHYVDTNNNMIGYDVETTGYVGDKYNTRLRRFKGYTLINIVGDVEGEYTEKTKEVTYIYQLNEAGGTQPSDDINYNDDSNNSKKQSTSKEYGVGHTEISVPNTGIDNNNYLLLIIMLILSNVFLIKFKYQ